MKKFLLIILLSVGSTNSPLFSHEIHHIGSTLYKQANGVQVVGNYAYAIFNNGLVILDITHPFSPQIIGQCYLQGEGKAVAVLGSYAYVASGSAGLTIIDITSPDSPYIRGGIDSLTNTLDIGVQGTYVYLVANIFSNWPPNFSIIDISQPDIPQIVGGYRFGVTPTAVAVSLDYAYVSFGSAFYVLDISDPLNPRAIGGSSLSNAGFNLSISGNYLYVAEGGSEPSYNLQIFDITNRQRPSFMSSFDAGDDALDVYAQGNYAYLALGNSGLQIVNVSDPIHPVLAGVYNPNRSTCGVWGDGNYAYNAEGIAGLAIIDVSNQSDHPFEGRFNPSWNPQAISVSGNYSFVISDKCVLKIIDISNPVSPVNINDFNIQFETARIKAVDDYIYAATKAGLQIINVKDPLNPFLMGNYGTNPGLVDIEVLGEYAFLTGGRNFYIINISDPTNPTYTGGLGHHYFERLAISGDYAYINGGTPSSNWIYSIDLHNLTNPQIIGQYGSTESNDACIYANGQYVYINGSRYLEIVNISDPTHPSFASRYEAWGEGGDIKVSGNYAYFAGFDNSCNFTILNVSDPNQPRYGAYFHGCTDAAGLDIANGYIYVADHTAFTILQYDGANGIYDSTVPNQFTTLQNYPNPFNSATTITLSGAERADIGIYDITGRLITILHAEHGRAVWDASGYSSGLYFARVAGEKASTIKLVLVK